MSNSAFRFAFITDPQLGMNSPSGLRGAGSDKERFDRAIAYVNDNDIAFVVLGGDQIHDADNEHSDEELDILEESLSALTVPYYGVAGNHEQLNPEDGCKYFDRGLPVRFSLTHGNLHMIGINGSWLRGGYGDEWHEREWDYLTSQLSQVPAECNHRFIVMHYPLFYQMPISTDDDLGMPNHAKIIDLYEAHGITCVLSGHIHQDMDARWRGISLIASVGTAMSVHYPEEVAFKVITVFDDGWSVRRVAVGDT